ncbi:hypothetical protein BH20ACT23_BH20ACT23_22740 [soil metagenome]
MPLIRVERNRIAGSFPLGRDRRRRRVLACCLVGLSLVSACDGSSGDEPNGRTVESRDLVSEACRLPRSWISRIWRGTEPSRSPDIITVPRTPNFYAGFPSGGFEGTSHSGVWGYLQEVPLVLYGPGFIRSQGPVRLERPVTLADVAPTQARLLDPRVQIGGPGRPFIKALVPEGRRISSPKIILTVVWDGGGWNVLRRWRSEWPYLSKLARRGTSILGATVGSSPSVTPSVHATLGTGRYPRQHQVVDAQMRVGGEVHASWARSSPKDLEAPTLADVYDPLTNNRAKIGMVAFRSWHLGMIGHGSFMRGGDKDVAVMNHRDSRLFTQPHWYSLPAGLADPIGLQRGAASVDVFDGRRDGRWRDHDVLADPSHIFESPAWPLYQTRLIEGLIEKDGFGRGGPTDLLYTNFKQIDLLGHAYNMLNREVGDAVHFSDVALKQLVRVLNREVGRKEWVLMLTADHGQQPNALSVGGWPIGTDELISDLTSHFGVGEEIVEIWRPTGVWLDHEEMKRADPTTDEIAQFLAGYTLRESASEPAQVPEQFQSRLAERVFQAVFPSENLEEVWECGWG